MPVLPQSFYARDALEVARDLLGKHLVSGDVVLRISEVEAYRWPNDTASHCRMGRTPRNAPMWGPPGHAYVYLCYGIHRMLNVVTNREGEGAAVLIRACEPVAGLAEIEARRGGVRGPAMLTGPGKVGSALALTLDQSGAPLFASDAPLFASAGLTLHDAPAVERVIRGPRVGIEFASAGDRRALYRLAIAGSLWVSARRLLR